MKERKMKPVKALLLSGSLLVGLLMLGQKVLTPTGEEPALVVSALDQTPIVELAPLKEEQLTLREAEAPEDIQLAVLPLSEPIDPLAVWKERFSAKYQGFTLGELHSSYKEVSALYKIEGRKISNAKFASGDYITVLGGDALDRNLIPLQPGTNRLQHRSGRGGVDANGNQTTKWVFWTPPDTPAYQDLVHEKFFLSKEIKANGSNVMSAPDGSMPQGWLPEGEKLVPYR